MSEEASVNKQLNAIVDGFNQRVGSGVIPIVDHFDSAKFLKAASIVTDKGLKLKVYAEKELGEIENVVLAIEDYGQDAELKTLIKKIHGDIPIRGIEVSMHSELYSDMVGEGKLIDPPGESGPGTHTSTYTFVSPEVTQALMERIPLMPSK